MALQTRRGPYSQFDPAKMTPGEPASVLSGDPSVPSGKAFYVCYAAGDVKRLVAIEDIEAMVARGEFKGDQGVSVVNGKVNAAGNLMITLSNGTSVDTGYVVGPTGPEGKKGDTGQKGDTGSQGVGVLRGVVNEAGHLMVTLTDNTVIDTGYVVGPKGADGTVSFDKLTPAQQLSLKGDAATINVGTVTTLTPGQQATVRNRGTTGDAVFDFAIPKGDKGDTGGLSYATFDVVGGELIMENDPDLSGTNFSLENGELILEVTA